MTPAEILAQAAQRGVEVGLSPPGDGLSLLSDGDPPEDLVELIKSAKPEILALLQTERRRINHWIAASLISWPPDRCLHCRRPIIPGQTWTAVSNGEVTARFHEPCHVEWLAQQEIAARRALGLDL